MNDANKKKPFTITLELNRKVFNVSKNINMIKEAEKEIILLMEEDNKLKIKSKNKKNVN